MVFLDYHRCEERLTSSSRRLARVDMADDDNVNMSFLLSMYALSVNLEMIEEIVKGGSKALC